MKATVIRSTGIKTPSDIRQIELGLEIVPRVGEYFVCELELHGDYVNFYGWVNRVEWQVTHAGQSAIIYIGAIEPR